MRRRDFIAAVGGVAAMTFAARAQEGVKRRRVGFLMHLAPGDPDAMARVAGFLQGLQEHGWATDRNIQIDYRWAVGQAALYRKHAAELVRASAGRSGNHCDRYGACERETAGSLTLPKPDNCLASNGRARCYLVQRIAVEMQATSGRHGNAMMKITTALLAVLPTLVLLVQPAHAESASGIVVAQAQPEKDKPKPAPAKPAKPAPPAAKPAPPPPAAARPAPPPPAAARPAPPPPAAARPAPPPPAAARTTPPPPAAATAAPTARPFVQPGKPVPVAKPPAVAPPPAALRGPGGRPAAGV